MGRGPGIEIIYKGKSCCGLVSILRIRLLEEYHKRGLITDDWIRIHGDYVNWPVGHAFLKGDLVATRHVDRDNMVSTLDLYAQDQLLHVQLTCNDVDVTGALQYRAFQVELELGLYPVRELASLRLASLYGTADLSGARWMAHCRL